MEKTWIENIYDFDIYGARPQVRIGKDEFFRSGLGVIFTLISFFIIIGLTTKFGLALFDTTTPLTTLSVLNANNPPSFELNKDNFAFVIGLQSKNYNLITDESIIRFEAFQNVIETIVKGNKTESIWNQIPLPIERCSAEKFELKFQGIFSSISLNDRFCLKNQNFYLNGTFVSPIYSTLLIQLSQCENSTLPNSPVCRPQEEINEILSFGYFEFGYSDISIDPTDYNNPDKYYNGNKYFSVSNNYFQDVNQNQKTVTIETDTGWLFDAYEKKTILQKEDYITSTEFKKTNLLLKFTLRFSTRIEVYKRRYTKIQDVAAQVGGIIKVFILIFQFIINKYNSSNFYQYLTNQLFYINDDKKINHFIDKNGNTQQRLMVISRKAEIEKKPPQLKLNLLDSFIFMLPFCCYSRSNRNTRNLYLSSLEINRRLDIVYFFKKFNDIERMKKVLFNSDMLQLFNLPWKEELILNHHKLENESNNQIKKNSLLQSYNRIKEKGETKEKFKKLLSILDHNNIQF